MMPALSQKPLESPKCVKKNLTAVYEDELLTVKTALYILLSSSLDILGNVLIHFLCEN